MKFNSTYYHVRITQESAQNDEVKLDLSEAQLKKKFLKPYKDGRTIVINGKTIPPDEIERIRINRTEQSSDKLLPKIKKKRKSNSAIAVGIPDEWYVADEGEDVTSEFITGPPGSGLDEGQIEKIPEDDERNVFVVHGRNLQIRDSMFNFLRAIDLYPIEWTQAIKATGNSSPYIGEILDEVFSTAQAVIVLMTPDDEARLREEFREEDEPPYEKELTPQPRPNVLYEGGIAMAKHPKRTVIVKIGNLRPFSDIEGMHYVKLDNTAKTKRELATKLDNAGCPVDISGTDWLDAGDFEIDQE